jgi:hypothetical protein
MPLDKTILVSFVRMTPVTLPRAGDEGLDNKQHLNIHSALILKTEHKS